MKVRLNHPFALGGRTYRATGALITVPAGLEAAAERLIARGTASRVEETLLGSSVQPTLIELAGGKTVQLGTVVAAAHQDSLMSIDEWNALPDDEREVLIARMRVQFERLAQQEIQDGGASVSPQSQPPAADASAAGAAEPRNNPESESGKPEATDTAAAAPDATGAESAAPTPAPKVSPSTKPKKTKAAL